MKEYYNCIFSIECNLRKHGAVTNQFPSILFQRQENWLRNWIGWPAVWRSNNNSFSLFNKSKCLCFVLMKERRELELAYGRCAAPHFASAFHLISFNFNASAAPWAEGPAVHQFLSIRSIIQSKIDWLPLKLNGIASLLFLGQQLHWINLIN